MSENLKIWDALGKTDPAHTKGFNRAGGFKGTSVKPMWVYKRLTEHFGPAGQGWGVNEPRFETVHSQGGEVLVYCTVSCWHGDHKNVLWGVGGDKAVSLRSGKLFHDDEAFKKATTDAIMNAFKTVGVAADIHMGLFDDDKYVAAMEQEFGEAPALISDAQVEELENLFSSTSTNMAPYLQRASDNAGREVKDLRDLPVSEFEKLKAHLITKQPKEMENA